MGGLHGAEHDHGEEEPRPTSGNTPGSCRVVPRLVSSAVPTARILTPGAAHGRSKFQALEWCCGSEHVGDHLGEHLPGVADHAVAVSPLAHVGDVPR